MTKPNMLETATMGLCRVLPRGGFWLARLARRILPGLASYPARLKFCELVLRGDVAHNVFYPLVIYGYYSHQTVEDDLMAEIAKGAKLIVDVGGNIGYTAALLATFAPDAEIVVFEPLPVCQSYLRQVADHFPNVEIRMNALSDKAGTAQFLARDSIDRSSLVGKGDAKVAETVEVDVTTLDDAFAGKAVDVIKIDVEGFEPEVLRGAKLTIARCEPIVLFEAYEAEVFQFAIQFFSQLDRGYHIFVINNDGHLRTAAGLLERAGDTCNYVAWPKSRSVPQDLSIPQCYQR